MSDATPPFAVPVPPTLPTPSRGDQAPFVQAATNANARAQLAPVLLPEDLPDTREAHRQALLAKLHSRTNQMSNQRRRQAKAAPKVEEAARTMGMQSQASSAQAMLGSMRAEDVANLVQSTMRAGVIPEHLRALIPPEARNLNKKDLTKLIRQLQNQ